MLGTGVKTFTGARTGIAWSTRLQRESEREKDRGREIRNTVTIFSSNKTLQDGTPGHSDNQHTNLQELFVWLG